ncbi:MAG: hypothetical protein A2X49_03845 [Lentisphaerae bacterium GWF2_52_8]|nr:MAG: hypothetical protein A2X49_03845 [Lentisphaerae bacterium GWF2_52_8]
MDWREVYPFVRPYRGLIAASVISLIAFTALGLVMPWFLKVIIDRALGGGDLSLLYLLLGGIIIVYMVREVFFYVSHYMTNYIAQRMLFDLRIKLFKHIQSLSLRFYQEYRTGKLISNIITDVSALQGMVSTVMIQLIVNVFMIVFITVALFVMNPKLSLICLVIMPLFYLDFAYFRKKMQKQSHELRERMSEISANLAETLNGIKVVKSFGKERAENKEFVGMLRPAFNMSLSLSMDGVYCWIIAESIHIASLVLALGWGGLLVSRGEMSIGELMGYYWYLGMMIGPLNSITSLSTAISDGTTSAQRIMKLLSSVPEVKERENPLSIEHPKGHVRFESVSFAYSGSQPVLKNFTLDIKPGLKVAMVGPSGSGKSTIASLLMRFFDAKEGRITIDGVALTDMSMESLRKNVGIVLQESFLFSGSIEENILYGRDDANKDEIIAAAKMANAHDFIMALPNGYKSQVGENGVSLSGGQKQRIAIARAILRNPSVLILDEATSALDTVAESAVQEALDKLMQNRTTIIIAHRLSTVRNSDLIVVLKDGVIGQQGRHEDLLKEEGLYRELYATQLHSDEDEGAEQQDTKLFNDDDDSGWKAVA